MHPKNLPFAVRSRAERTRATSSSQLQDHSVFRVDPANAWKLVALSPGSKASRVGQLAAASNALR